MAVSSLGDGLHDERYHGSRAQTIEVRLYLDIFGMTQVQETLLRVYKT